MPNTHGGARPGAGRPPKADAMCKRMYVLRLDQIEWLTKASEYALISRSELLRLALDKYIATEAIQEIT